MWQETLLLSMAVTVATVSRLLSPQHGAGVFDCRVVVMVVHTLYCGGDGCVGWWWWGGTLHIHLLSWAWRQTFLWASQCGCSYVLAGNCIDFALCVCLECAVVWVGEHRWRQEY